MGTGLFDYIAQACQSLAATVAPLPPRMADLDSAWRGS